MARKRTKPTAKQAQTLLDWLITLDLPTRVINALRRDLEVVMGQREGEPGSGVLAGVDQARFTEELYRNGGGQVGHVPSVAKSAIEALRAAIPAPASADGGLPAGGGADVLPLEAEVLPPAETTLTPADTSDSPVYGDDFVLPPLDDEESTTPAESAEALELAPSVAAEVAGDVAAPAEASELTSAPPAPSDAPAAPVRRRGRPPRSATAPTPTPEPSASAEVPVRRRGRPRRSEAAPVVFAAAPAPAQEVRTATAAMPPAPEPLPAVLPVLDPSADVLLRLWRELHPQGRQATLHYIAGLLIEA